MTVSNVLGQGRQKGYTEIYRGAKEVGGLLRKVRLDIAVNEEFVEPTIKAITKGARTGDGGRRRQDFCGGSYRMRTDQHRRTGREAIG